MPDRELNATPQQDRPLRTAVTFTVLSLSFAWLYWAAVTLCRTHTLPFSMGSDEFVRDSIPGTIVWAVFSGFGPAIAGVIAVAICQGRGGVMELWRSVARWRIPGWLYVAGMFGVVINVAVVAAGYAVGEMHMVHVSVASFIGLFFPMVVLDGPLGEEIGWRGVLLPQLLRRFNALPSALIVGVVWYLWHIPVYLANERFMTAGEHAQFLYVCIALSVIFTWFFLKSGGSTFLAIYLHAWSNYATFVRFKTFARTGTSPIPMYAYVIVLTALAILAAAALFGQKATRNA